MSLEHRPNISHAISSLEGRKDPKYLEAAIPLLSRHLLYDNPSIEEEIAGYRHLKKLWMEGHGHYSHLANVAMDARWAKIGFYEGSDYADYREFEESSSDLIWQVKATIVALGKKFSDPNAQRLTKKQFVDDFFPFYSSRQSAVNVLEKLKKTYVLTEDAKYAPLITEKRGAITMGQPALRVLLPHLPVLEAIVGRDTTNPEILAADKAIKDSTLEALSVGKKFFQRRHIARLSVKDKSGSTFCSKNLGMSVLINATPGSFGEQNLKISVDGQEKGSIEVKEDNTFEATGALKPELPGSLGKADKVIVAREGTEIEWSEVPEIRRKINFAVKFNVPLRKKGSIEISELGIGENLPGDDESRWERNPKRMRNESIKVGSFEFSLRVPNEYEVSYVAKGKIIKMILQRGDWTYELNIPRSLDSAAVANEMRNKMFSILSGIDREAAIMQRENISYSDLDREEIDDTLTPQKPTDKSPAELRTAIETELGKLPYHLRGKVAETALRAIDDAGKQDVESLKYCLKEIRNGHAWEDDKAEELFRLLKSIYLPKLSDEEVLGVEEKKEEPKEKKKPEYLPWSEDHW